MSIVSISGNNYIDTIILLPLFASYFQQFVNYIGCITKYIIDNTISLFSVAYGDMIHGKYKVTFKIKSTEIVLTNTFKKIYEKFMEYDGRNSIRKIYDYLFKNYYNEYSNVFDASYQTKSANSINITKSISEGNKYYKNDKYTMYMDQSDSSVGTHGITIVVYYNDPKYVITLETIMSEFGSNIYHSNCVYIIEEKCNKLALALKSIIPNYSYEHGHSNKYYDLIDNKFVPFGSVKIDNDEENNSDLEEFKLYFKSSSSGSWGSYNAFKIKYYDTFLLIVPSDNRRDSCFSYSLSVTPKTNGDICNIINFILDSNVCTNSPTYYYYNDNQWAKKEAIEKRNFDNVYLPKETKADIMTCIDNFMKYTDVYKDFQVTHRMGILLYGPPGTGKTSVVKAIANHYNLNVCVVDLNNQYINDSNISTVFNSLGNNNNNKILLFEDIDTCFADKNCLKYEDRTNIMENKTVNKNDNVTSEIKLTKKEQKYLTYSGLLNALDGLQSVHTGVITIMTTNNIDKLGDALIRPGRMDYKFKLDICAQSQIAEMMHGLIGKIVKNMKLNKIDYNYDSIDDRINKLINNIKCFTVKPCELQSYIIKHLNNLDDIFSCYSELSNI